jgi:hypothetical protein
VIPFIPPYFPTQAPVIPAQSQPRGHTHVSRARKHTDKRPKRHASISSNTAVWDSMAGSTVCGNGTESIAGRSIRSSASSAPDNNTYERQRQVAHWVEDTDAHASRFINPFAPPSDPSTPRTNSYQPRTKEDAARAMSGGKRKSMPPVWVPAPTVLPAQQPPQVPTIIVQPPQYIPPPQMMPPPQMILQVPSTPVATLEFIVGLTQF